AHIIMACRDVERAEEARADILEDTGNENIVIRKLDLSDTKSIRAFCQLINKAPARIVVVASVAHTWTGLQFDDLNSERNYDAMKAYGQSKLANVLFARSLAKRLQGGDVNNNLYKVKEEHVPRMRCVSLRQLGFFLLAVFKLRGHHYSFFERTGRKQKIAMATAIGFAIMGFIGFFVKLIHIPINNIIV
ncbi:hypothetical protein GOODEAATRI_023461, partial [Goodea atripinnis]